MANTNSYGTALAIATYQLETTSDKASNLAQLLFTVAEAFEADVDTAEKGWALRPIAESIQDLGDDCVKTLSMMREDDEAEAVA